MKNFKQDSFKLSIFNHPTFKQTFISGSVGVMLIACSSGTKESHTVEHTTKKAEPVLTVAAMSKPVEKKIMTESLAMSDAHILASSAVAKNAVAKNTAYHSTQHRFRAVKPAIDDTENYQHYTENAVKLVLQQPVSTFSIDVDTGSYTNVRRMINQGMLPPADSIRIEEFINYFAYNYLQTSQNEADTPFSIDTAIATSPWAEQRHIMRIALKGFTPDVKKIAGRNLVFLLDVSGSMNQSNKLPLLIRSLELLTGQLSEQDSVSIVVYAGASGVVLEPTKGNQNMKIKQALQSLSAGGATNGQAGIELAYNMAEQAFIKDGVNRVMLATDGNFNVGMTSQKSLIELIKQKRHKGIALTTLGFGQGNYNDHLMEQLADAGNGNYAYIDNIHEARKVFVDEVNATLLTIAKDVKIQVEFNPQRVLEYRLLGYENRVLNREDFNNDKVDAGEIGAGHTVTALYELTLNTSNNPYLDPLRYQKHQLKNKGLTQPNQFEDELALVKLRYKPVDSQQSQLVTQAVLASHITDFAQQSDDFRFATSVVGFAHLLKQSHYWQDMNYQQIVDLAQLAKGKDEYGYRAEFINLVRTSSTLQTSKANQLSNQLQQVELNVQGLPPNIDSKATLVRAN
jgi:Ca-activated chloride channel family protein